MHIWDSGVSRYLADVILYAIVEYKGVDPRNDLMERSSKSINAWRYTTFTVGFSLGNGAINLPVRPIAMISVHYAASFASYRLSVCVSHSEHSLSSNHVLN